MEGERHILMLSVIFFFLSLSSLLSLSRSVFTEIKNKLQALMDIWSGDWDHSHVLRVKIEVRVKIGRRESHPQHLGFNPPSSRRHSQEDVRKPLCPDLLHLKKRNHCFLQLMTHLYEHNHYLMLSRVWQQNQQPKTSPNISIIMNCSLLPLRWC